MFYFFGKNFYKGVFDFMILLELLLDECFKV